MTTKSNARAWRKASLLAAAAWSAIGIAPSATAQTAPTAGPAADTQGMEDIIVTASRRATSLRETPIAISAYSGAQLEKAHIQTLGDLTTQSPNIQFGSNGGNTNIAIRGIGTNLQTAGSDPGVALHIDGIYVSDPALALLTLLDVKRVEVLRGPQGTLFGRNATGGAINIISNTPTTSPEYGFRASAGAPAGDHVDIYASGPLNSDGTLLGRLSAEQTYQRGFVKNVTTTGPNRLEGRNDFAGRLQLEWRPTSDFSIRVMGDYQKSDTAGAAYFLVGTPNTAAGLPPQLASSFIGRPGDDKIAVTDGVEKLQNQSIALFADWKVGTGNLRATVSYRDTDNYRSFDGDGTPFNYTSTIVTQYRKSTYAELLYNSDDSKPFSFILGGNYFNDKEIQDVVVPVFGFPAPVLLFGDSRLESFAVFGHATYKITNSWKVFGGIRYSTDHKRLDETNNFIGARSHSDRFSKPTFEVGTSYELNPSTNAYVKYATGYKSGGYSAGSLGPSFDSETNSMWEAGLKGAYFGGALQANLALFHMSYKNLQVNQVVGVSSQVTNAAQASINGAELEMALKLTPNLTFQFDGGWLDATFDGFQTQDSARPQLGLLDLTGNRLPNAPKFTVGGGPVYTHSFANSAKLTLSGRYDWKSRVYFSEFNLPLVSQKPVGRLSVYASYELPGGRWQIGLYGRNLTNQHVYSSMVVDSAVLNSITLATLQPRREFGIELRGRF